jgi:hypothetical protein
MNPTMMVMIEAGQMLVVVASSMAAGVKRRVAPRAMAPLGQAGGWRRR